MGILVIASTLGVRDRVAVARAPRVISISAPGFGRPRAQRKCNIEKGLGCFPAAVMVMRNAFETARVNPTVPLLQWPPAPDEPPVVTIDSAVLIMRPLAAVFDFATNASFWTAWQPATAAVSAAPRRPLVTSDTATEAIRIGLLRFNATWTVLACERPTLWVIATQARLGDARIVYALRADSDTGPTRLIRTLEYRSRPWPLALLDRNAARWTLERQSHQALDNLKRVLERGGRA